MPRNGSGTYSLPEAPFVPNTAILSAEVNSDFDDIADALTGSVAGDGQTLMTGALAAFAGTLALPGWSWAVDSNTGRYRSASDEMTDVVGGVAQAVISATGVNFPVAASVAGAGLPFPAGTVMLFKQTAAPTGWTKSVTDNDKALRVVSGTAGTGGSTAFTTVFAARTIAQANLPSYNLSASSLAVSGTITPKASGGADFCLAKSSNANPPAGSNNSARVVDETATATFSLTASGNVPSGGSGTTMDFAVQYVDVIVASKN